MSPQLQVPSVWPGPFTVADTPDVVERINGDLQHIADVVSAADPHLRALVLTGGFARGEGAVRQGEPQNDYDLVAVRGLRGSRVPYPHVRARLEDELGLHIDLAPVASARLRWTSPSIFWYETALRGRVLRGQADVLARIPVRHPTKIRRDEGLRLLINRAAGLLLEMRGGPHDKRIQASKALLGSLDARLLALGLFPPSHLERWQEYDRLRTQGSCPPRLEDLHPWLSWAISFKTRPDAAPPRDPDEAWDVAARAVLHAVPVALEHAGHASMEAYAASGDIIERLHHARHAGRWTRHPSGRVRLATIAMLEAAVQDAPPDEAVACLRSMVPEADPVDMLKRARAATLQ